MYEELQQKVERERQRLAAIINRFGINHNQTIKQSEKLDKLIVDYLRETNK
ncbi:MAG TPA: aspartyl-phosphate phosphatase Spo0E family protein [Oscillospiraceae bacterium]|nr:aspartyl-phosphate phosphatase Spo0E family protein [Oscillospiraceae bacterium]